MSDYLSTIQGISNRSSELDYASSVLLGKSTSLETSELAGFTQALNDDITNIGSSFTSAIQSITADRTAGIEQGQAVVGALEGGAAAIEAVKSITKDGGSLDKFAGFFETSKKAKVTAKVSAKVPKKAVTKGAKDIDVEDLQARLDKVKPKSLSPEGVGSDLPSVPSDLPSVPAGLPEFAEAKDGFDSLAEKKVERTDLFTDKPTAPDVADITKKPVERSSLKSDYSSMSEYTRSEDISTEDEPIPEPVEEIVEPPKPTFGATEMNQFDQPDIDVNKPILESEYVNPSAVPPKMNERFLPELKQPEEVIPKEPKVRGIMEDVELKTISKSTGEDTSSDKEIASQLSKDEATRVRQTARQGTKVPSEDTSSDSQIAKSLSEDEAKKVSETAEDGATKTKVKASTGDMFTDEKAVSSATADVEAGASEAVEAEVAGGGFLDPAADVVAGALLVTGLVMGGLEIFGDGGSSEEKKAEAKAEEARDKAVQDAKNLADTKEANIKGQYDSIKDNLASNTHAGVTIGVQSVRNSYRSTGTF